jgi:hypothetical protein
MSHDKLPPTKIFYEFMKNLDGESNMNVDGSASVSGTADFYISCPAGDEILLHRAMISIYDTKGMEDEEYGDLGSSLSAGLELKVLSSDGTTVLADLTGGLPIKTNQGWSQVCYDFGRTAFVNTTNAVAAGRWTFSKGGNPIYLKAGQRLQMDVNDDLTGLISQRIMIQGHKL